MPGPKWKKAVSWALMKLLLFVIVLPSFCDRCQFWLGWLTRESGKSN